MLKSLENIVSPHKEMLQKHLSNPGRAVIELGYTRMSPLYRGLIEQSGELLDICRLRTAVPARSPVHQGRTFYVYVDQRKIEDAPPLVAIKVKGAAAVIFDSINFCTIDSCKASEAYAPEHLPIPHFSILPGMKFSVAYESKKAAFSLVHDSGEHHLGADREFDCMERLSKVGLSQTPLFSAVRLVNNKPELDCFERVTGVTSSVFDLANNFGSYFVKFFVFQFKPNEIIFIPEENTVHEGSSNISETCKNLFTAFSRMAEAKRDSLIFSHVARHNGNLGNWLAKDFDQKWQLADFDSALLLDHLDQNYWGPQLVRDFTSDTMRMLSALTINAAIPTFLSSREFIYEPFYNIVSGYFSGLAPKPEIVKMANYLTDSYLSVVERGQRQIFHAREDLFHQLMSEDSSRENFRNVQARIDDILFPLYSDVTFAYYDLARKSPRLKELGFTVPDINKSERDIKQQFQAGLRPYRDAMLSAGLL